MICITLQICRCQNPPHHPSPALLQSPPVLPAINIFQFSGFLFGETKNLEDIALHEKLLTAAELHVSRINQPVLKILSGNWCQMESKWDRNVPKISTNLIRRVVKLKIVMDGMNLVLEEKLTQKQAHTSHQPGGASQFGRSWGWCWMIEGVWTGTSSSSSPASSS